MPRLRQGSADGARRKLLLPPEQVSGRDRKTAFGRRFSHARVPPQGDAQQLRQAGIAGSVRIAYFFRLGRKSAFRRQTRHICVAGRALQLYHRARIRGRRRRTVQKILARRRAYDGKGDSQVPFRHMARVFDRARPAPSQKGVRARLDNVRRRQDEQVEGQRGGSLYFERQIRGGHPALLYSAHSALRRGRRIQQRNARALLQFRPCKHAGQPGIAYHRHDRQILRKRSRARRR